MSCESNNATPPTCAAAPGGDFGPPARTIDPRRAAGALVERFGVGGAEPRLAALVPGFDAPFYQAGLAGYSDAAMRLIARSHGCPLCVTEALLDRTLLGGGRGFAKADLGRIESNIPGGAGDHPLVGQIMGSDPAEMAAAAVKMIEQGRRKDKEYRSLHSPPSVREQPKQPQAQGFESLGFEQTQATRPSRTFAAIDINLACPVKKIARKARGGHWLREPDGAIRILEAVRGAVPASIPVTVKMRIAFDDSPDARDHFHRIFDAAYDIGCAWVTVHGRTVEQKYIGPSRWEPLSELVRRNPDRLIFGSGDIWTAGDIFRMIAYTGVSGVSVARGAIGNPWVFRQARDLLDGREPSPPTLGEQRRVLEDHFRLALGVHASKRHPEHHTAKCMRKFGIRFSTHHPTPEPVRKAFIAAGSLDDWRGVLDAWYQGG